jgi:hypothetical protein
MLYFATYIRVLQGGYETDDFSARYLSSTPLYN